MSLTPEQERMVARIKAEREEEIQEQDKEETSLTSEQQRMVERIKAGRQEEEMSGLDQAAAAAGQFAEGTLGVGDEAGAIGRGIGGTIYDVFNSDKSTLDSIADNFNWDRNIEATREGMDKLDEVNPLLSNAAYGAGMVTGLAVPAATVKGGLKTKSLIAGAEGAAYGALSGRDEGRVDSALLGAGGGAVVGAGAHVIGKKLAEVRAKKDATALDEVELLEEAAEKWEAGSKAGKGGEVWDDYATGVSDVLRRRVSEEVGLRVQRADETALRQNTKERAEIIQNKPMGEVISLADTDATFKGMLLDFGRHSVSADSLLGYVKKELGQEQSNALRKYLSWSESSNAKYNKALGNNSSASGYLHTQKEKGLPKKSKQKDDFGDDAYNQPAKDKGELERERGLHYKGEVKPEEYVNPLLSNMNRIQNNNRLIQLQQKFGVTDINGGAPQLVDEIQKAIQKKGIDEGRAIDARNSIVSLVRGQNKMQNNWISSFQNLSYAGTLAGPKTSVLNVHDIPMAGWNNGVGNMMKAFSKASRGASDLERLGISNQTMGEFTQALTRDWRNSKGLGEHLATGTKALTTGLFKLTGFEKLDRLGKRGVLGTVSSRLRNEAKDGKFTDEFAAGFDEAEKTQLANALNKSGGDVSKMSKKDLALYDEAVTLGLGQQQLLSAAGRPEKWLNHTALRPVYMLRGFAIKQNALLSRKVYEKFKEGDMKGAAAEAGKFIALPGASYAALNVGRNEAFKDDYEASGEEFMYSMLDALVGPMTLNMVGVGSSYSRQKLEDNPFMAIAEGLLPPGGVTENTLKSISKAISKEDPEELAAIITNTPAYKQFSALLD